MSTGFFSADKKSAFDSIVTAQWIAFGPVVFQAARVLRDSGILKLIEENNKTGITLNELSEKAGLSIYGVRVLLESGLSIGLVLVNEGRYTLTKTGHYILHDSMTRVNMDFVQDICYKGMYTLEESIKTGKPEGLKDFGEWKTIYEGLSKLPEKAKKSWLSFDHFFSDEVFPVVLPRVYSGGIKKLLDIGGNTGKWAIASSRYQSDIQVTIMDLPGQLEMAREKIAEQGLSNRVSFIPANILDENTSFPTGFDAIWLSQCLDCFSENEIISILRRCGQALDSEGFLFILEPFWDKQKFEVAAFCLHQTSIYFTTIANGNSQMYSAETFLACVTAAGFEVVEQTHQIGLGQSLLKCKKDNL